MGAIDIGRGEAFDQAVHPADPGDPVPGRRRIPGDLGDPAADGSGRAHPAERPLPPLTGGPAGSGYAPRQLLGAIEQSTDFRFEETDDGAILIGRNNDP